MYVIIKIEEDTGCYEGVYGVSYDDTGYESKCIADRLNKEEGRKTSIGCGSVYIAEYIESK